MSNLSVSKSLIILLPLLLLTISGCNTIKLDGHYTARPISIDGNYADWKNIPALYFEDQEVLLALSNDEDNLYMAFRFRDPKWLMAIHKTGLTIWLDNSGKKKENFGIKYMGGPNPQNNLGFERFKKNMPNSNRQNENRYVDSTKLFSVLNSDWWYKEQNIIADGTFGPKVKYGYENDMYTYEFAVPLSAFGENFYGMDARSGQNISIGLVWGDIGFKRPSGAMGGKGGGMSGGGGMGGGGGRGGVGGGMGGGGGKGGGMGGGNAAMMNNMPSEQKIWIKTKLAVME